MARYELSLSANYVQDWSVVEAIRELFQNALDQQVEKEDNEMFFHYSPSDQTLSVSNKASVLDIKSLLLGESTKRDNKKTIGLFGEGYKLALLVLCRLGKSVTIFNYGKKEMWKPKLIDSRRYGATILVVDVDAKYFWQNVPDNNLTFQVEGVTEEEYELIKAANLHLQEIVSFRKTNYGTILLEEEFQGKMYVNGLYISTSEDFQYGYDFKPEHISLDRDRRMLPSFDVKWKCSSMWQELGDAEKILPMIRERKADVAYLKETAFISDKKFQTVATTAYQEFRSEYGNKAIPCATQSEVNTLKVMYGNEVEPIVVSDQMKGLLESSVQLQEDLAGLKHSEVVEELSPKEHLLKLFELLEDDLNDVQKEAFEEVIERSEEWFLNG